MPLTAFPSKAVRQLALLRDDPERCSPRRYPGVVIRLLDRKLSIGRC